MTDLDPIAMTTLGKAVDFLFDQAGKLLEERREARSKRGGEVETAQATHPSQAASTATTTREEVKTWKPKTIYLKDIPSEIKHSLNMIEQYRTNKRHTEEAISHFGGFSVAPINVRNDLLQQEEQIEYWIIRLKELIEKAYGHKITLIGLD